MAWEIKNKAYRIAHFLRRVYYVMVSHENKVKRVWNDLKRLHIEADWAHGIYERERQIETGFEVENKNLRFYYAVDETFFYCRVKVLEDYPMDLTSDLFILAAHFNNSLRLGSVKINVNVGYVEYYLQRDLMLPLLYKGEIHSNINFHYAITKDVYSAFQRLVIEREAPAIIFADLLRKNESGSDEQQ
ncbi:MAG: hypothetical protein ACKOW8_04425 [Flavobacteriales bacterium]